LEQQVSSVISSGDGIGASLGLEDEFQKVLIQNLLLKFINEHLEGPSKVPKRYQFIDLESELTVRK